MAKPNATQKNENSAPKADKNARLLKDIDYTVEASRTVPDGVHEGVIDGVALVERGEEGFRYLDVYVKDSASDVIIKAGFAAAKITPETDLGRLMQRFGADLAEGSTVRPLSFMQGHVGTVVRFTTTTEKNRNGRFARVALESLEPL